MVGVSKERDVSLMMESVCEQKKADLNPPPSELTHPQPGSQKQASTARQQRIQIQKCRRHPLPNPCATTVIDLHAICTAFLHFNFIGAHWSPLFYPLTYSHPFLSLLYP